MPWIHKFSTFLGGFSVLVLELALFRVAGRFTGVGALALALTLSLFLAGLSLPAFFIGKKIHPRLLRSILCLLAFSPLLNLAEPSANPYLHWLTLVFLIFLPGMACGHILPLIANSYPRRASKLYAIFNAGAASGLLAGGLYLLPRLGLQNTFYIVAACFVVCLLTSPALVNLEEDEDAEVAISGEERHDLLFLVLFSCIGMLAQSVLIRLTGNLVGSSVTSMALVSGIFISGNAAGNSLAIYVLSPWLKDRPRLALAFTALPTVAVLTLLLYALPLMPSLYQALRVPALGSSLAPVLLTATCFCLPPAIATGLVFPVINNRLKDRFTLALGLSVMSGVISPWLYYIALACQWRLFDQSVLVTLLRACALMAALAAAMMIGKTEKKLLLPILLLPLSTFLIDRASVDRALSAGTAYLSPGQAGHSELKEERANFEEIYFADGLVSTVSLKKSSQILMLSTNGKVEAVKALDQTKAVPTAEPTQILLALLPSCISAKTDSAFVIGLGLATTSDTLAALGWERVTCAELEEQISRANDVSAGIGRISRTAVLDELCRLLDIENIDKTRAKPEVRRVDGRQMLATNGTTYDVIVSQPSEPWTTGSGALFTREFLELTRRRLQEGGVFAQWLQLYGLERSTLVSYLRLFREIYPHYTVCLPPGGGEIILLGTRQERNVRESLSLAFAKMPERGLFAGARLKNLKQLQESILEGPDLDRILKGQEGDDAVSTDDNLALQYAAYMPHHGQSKIESTIEVNLRLLSGAKKPWLESRTEWDRFSLDALEEAANAHPGATGESINKLTRSLYPFN